MSLTMQAIMESNLPLGFYENLDLTPTKQSAFKTSILSERTSAAQITQCMSGFCSSWHTS